MREGGNRGSLAGKGGNEVATFGEEVPGLGKGDEDREGVARTGMEVPGLIGM